MSGVLSWEKSNFNSCFCFSFIFYQVLVLDCLLLCLLPGKVSAIKVKDFLLELSQPTVFATIIVRELVGRLLK